MDRQPDDMHLDGDALCDYAEGLMEGPARARAEIHLQGCAACRREIGALRGYFLEMEGLEPVKAPADFLAKVRARLPKPSPWKKALSALARPWRAIPVQIAFLTLLGATGITAYLLQRGGMDSEILPTSASQGAEPALKESPPAGAPGGEAPLRDAPVVVARVPDAKASRAPVRKLSAPPAPRAKSLAGRKGEASPPEAPASGRTRSESAKPGSVPDEAQSARESLSKRSISGEENRFSDREVSAEESISGADRLPDGNAPTEIRIRMRAIKDTTAMLAGLRAMGTEMKRLEKPDPEYLLIMPASRLPDNLTYLRRYGTVQSDAAAAPGSSTARITLLLRIL